jgi:dienelactone hydrolase
MRAAKADYQVVFLGGAVHSFTVTDAGNDPSKGSAYDPKADKRSWEMLLDFLKESVG